MPGSRSVAHAWVDHLRSRGTTPWREFERSAVAASGYGGVDLPGAQQLELLRRLNLAGNPDPRLVGRVLATEARGRGRPPLPIVDEGTVGGLPVVDPAGLPDRELLRYAATLIAEDLRTRRVVAPPAARPRRWRTTYALAGDPWVSAAFGRSLAEVGHPPGGRSPIVFVVGGPLDRLVVDCWLARCFGGGAPPWPRFQDTVIDGHLPRRADLPAVVERRRETAGADRVRVVLDPQLLPSLIGVRRPPTVVVPRVPHHAAELARVVGAALSGQVSAAVQEGLLRGTLASRLNRATGPSTTVDAAAHESLREAAVQMSRRLERSAVPIDGNLARLTPGAPEAATSEEAMVAVDSRAFDLALEVLLP